MPGYLATVDDAAENAFLLGKMLAHKGQRRNAGWIGASDMSNEETFEWLDGFKGGSVFYRDGSPVNGQYSNVQKVNRTSTARRTGVRDVRDGPVERRHMHKRRQFVTCRVRRACRSHPFPV